MTKREAKKQARAIVWALLESYFATGQPLAEAHDGNMSEDDAKALETELRAIQQQFRRLP
jgi:hypothetical protein